MLIFKKKAVEVLFCAETHKDLEQMALFLYKKSIPNVHKNYTFRRIFELSLHNIEESYINMNEVIYKEGEVSDKICVVREG